MNDWLSGLCELNGRGEAVVLVTVAQTRGSTPREPGAKMIVGAGDIRDTIGGGQLEHAAIESARLLLEQGDDGYANTLERHALGPALGQCCGGVAWILLERIPGRPQAWIDVLMDARRGRRRVFMATHVAEGSADKRVLRHPAELAGASVSGDVCAPVVRSMETTEPVYDKEAQWFIDPVPPMDLDVVLFGAGHVGKAVAGILATLPCNLTWVDSRREQFPENPAARIEALRFPESLVDDCPPGAFYLVMTHSHPLDLAICERILRRADFAYCGLIGSQSKRRNFEKRLRLKGITESALNRLTCPIGVDGITGKRPAEIAVAAAAELLQVRESMRSRHDRDVSTAG